MPNIALDLGKQTVNFGVKNAYGEPQELDGTTVTPVALTFTEFGGGSDGEAGGGGGGGLAIPLGVYVQREEGLRFEPNTISLLAVATPFVWVVGRILIRLVRVLKK